MRNVYPANGHGRGDRPAYRAAGRYRPRMLLVMALAVAGAGFGTPPAAAEGGAIVDAELLNLRTEPGTWAWVAAQMGPGEAVSVLSGPTPEGWYQVQYGGLTGWASGDFLAFDDMPGSAPIEEQASPFVAEPAWIDSAAQTWADPEAVATDPSLAVGGMGAPAFVNQNDLKVLAAPNDQASVVDALGAGDAVTVVGGPVGGFVPIEHWSGEAWIWNGAIGQAAPAELVLLERWADVSRSTETVTLYEGDQPVASYWGAMGIDGSDAGFFATANGSYRVYEKYAALSWTDYGNAWVSDWIAFDPNRLNGFHSYSMDWAGQVIAGGDGPTGGCVALAPWAADHLFSFLQLGSRVEVHW